MPFIISEYVEQSVGIFNRGFYEITRFCFTVLQHPEHVTGFYIAVQILHNDCPTSVSNMFYVMLSFPAKAEIYVANLRLLDGEALLCAAACWAGLCLSVTESRYNSRATGP